MGATSSAQRGGKCEGDAEEPSAGQNQAQGDSDEDKLLQKNGQISTLNERAEIQTGDLKGCCEERVLADAGSGFVSVKEDGTETSEDLKEGEAYDANTENLFKDADHEKVTMKMESQSDNKEDDVEVGFKRFFRFVGFRFTLKKDKCDKNDAEEPIISDHDKKDDIQSANSTDNIATNDVIPNEQYTEGMHKESIEDDQGVESKSGDLASATDNEMEIVQISEITEHNEEITSDKELVDETETEPEESMSPFKKFFTQGIFASIGKRRKEEITPKEEKRKKDAEKLVGAEKIDNTCVCLDVSNITLGEDKNVQTSERDGGKAADEELMNSQEPSPFKRLFRKLSTRRQRETKPAETNVIDSGENLNDKISKTQSAREFNQKEDEEMKVEELRPVVEEHTLDISSEESKRKSDSNVSWEALICGGSSKKRSRKTSDSEEDTQDIEEPRKTTESPFVSSNEGDYDHLTSSSDQGGSPVEGESESKWKTLKKLVTPKRKGKVEESGSPEQTSSDTEMTKDESSCSIKNLLPGRKKRKPDGWQEHTAIDEAGKANESNNEDDETPEVVPLSEYEIIEHESLIENEKTAECLTEKEMQLVEDDKTKLTKPLVKQLSNSGPSATPSDFGEELTEFISKHQQLSDIPEEGIVEESVITPVSSAEWETQDDTLAEDIVELTADAVTAPEPTEDFEDETTEMVSAVSQLSESPKTSGNVSPVLAKHDVSKTDVIYQEAVETISMTTNVLSITSKDKDPETLAVSVSPCIVESTVSTETKVLVVHKKSEATSFCTGLISQDIGAVENVLPLPLFEGISETSEAIPTELVSEDWANESETAEITAEDVIEAEVTEVKIEFMEAISPDDNNISCTETMINTEQANQKHAELTDANAKNVLSHETNVEEVKEYPIEVLNIQEIKPVHMALQEETRLLEEQVVTKEMNSPKTEGSLEIALEYPVLEQPAHYTEKLTECEKEHSYPDIEISDAEVEQVALAEIAVPEEQSITVSVPESYINIASEITKTVVHVAITEVGETVTHDVVLSIPDTTINEASETEQTTGVYASVVECPEITEAISIVSTASDVIVEDAATLDEEIQMENIPSLPVVDRKEIQVEVQDAAPEVLKENTESAPEVATAVVEGDFYNKVEEISEKTTAQLRTEPIPTEESGEYLAKNIDIEVEKLSKAIEHPFEEIGINTANKQASAQTTITDDESRAVEQEDMSNVAVKFEKLGISITPLVDHKSSQSTGDETCTVIHKEDKQEGEITSVISKQHSLQKESTKEAQQQLTTDNTKSGEHSVLQKDSELSPHELTMAVLSEPAAGDVKQTCTDSEGPISVDGPEHKEGRAKPELNTEITIESAESTQPPKTEHQVDTELPQTETAPLKTKESHVAESSLQLYEVDKQRIEDTVKMTETVSETAVEEPEQMMVDSSSDQKYNETESETGKSIVTKTEGNEFTISEQPVLTVHGSEATSCEVATTVEAICVHKEKDEAKLHNTQEPKALSTTLTEVSNITKSSIAIEVIQQKDEMDGKTVGFEQPSDTPDVSEQEIATEFQVEQPAISEKDIEAFDVIEPKEEVFMNIAEVEAVLLDEQIADASVVVEKENETISVIQPVTQTAIVHKLKANTVEMTKPSTDTTVSTEGTVETAEVSELEVKLPEVTTVVTELEAETPVVTSGTKNLDTVTTAITSVIKNTEMQSILTSGKVLIESTGTTLEEAPIQEETMVQVTQTHTVIPVVQVPTVFPVLKESETEKSPTGVEVSQSKMEIILSPERMEQAAVVTEQETQIPSETEDLVNFEPKTTIMPLMKDKIRIGSSVLTSVTCESQKIPVEISATTKEVQIPTVPTIKISTSVPPVQEPELPLVTEILDGPESIIQKNDIPLVTEANIQTTVQTKVQSELEVKTPVTVVTDLNAKASPVKSEVDPVVTQVAETLTVSPVINVPVVGQIPVVAPMVHTPAAEETEKSPVASKVQESHVIAPDTVEVEVKPTSQAEPEITKTTTFESKEHTKAVSEGPVAVPMVKTTEPLPEVEDDVWEDAVDDMRDECSITEVSAEFQDTTTSHSHT